MGEQLAQLKEFLYKNFYFHHRLIRMTHKAHLVLERIYHAYVELPDMLPPDVVGQAQTLGLERAVTDYIAGMTDRYANEEYRRLFEPTVLT
ncbi:MAG: deoxyguanosinetriphosphate triphosphohydrolase, partial [Trueperaceae bacterium]|nr:deoxyguanosinetriphosphate triphosphohydrolase [Trueperaceae bacterium]